MAQGADGVITVQPTARRMFELVEPLGVLPYGDDALCVTRFRQSHG